MSRPNVLKWVGALALGAFALGPLTTPAQATPVTGAAFTTVNTNVDGTGHCQNGNPNTNCNIYDGKQFVWLNGGPAVAYVGDGDYFFAVLDPGAQNAPNDGSAGNLSDDFDAYTNRTFSVSGGTVTYSGTHDFNSNKIRLMPYADTSNPGGVYILAICSLADGYPVSASNCKYDAFKIQQAPPATASTINVCKFSDDDLNGSKSDNESFLPSWKIEATGVDSPLSGITDQTGCTSFTVSDFTQTVTLDEVLQDGFVQTAAYCLNGLQCTVLNGVITLPALTAGNVYTAYFGNFNFAEGGAVSVQKTAVPDPIGWTIAKNVDKTTVKQIGGSAVFNYTVTVTHDTTAALEGKISIANSISFAIDHLKITDATDAGGTCVITPDTSDVSLAASQPLTQIASYVCTFMRPNIPTVQSFNTVKVFTADDTQVASDVQPFTFSPTSASVVDSLYGPLGNIAVNDTSPTTFTYSLTFPVPQFGCQTYTNTASSDTTGSASQTVTVCGPAKTGALTMGFWQNKNGQAIITGGASAAGVCKSGTWLRQYAPFQDLSSTATCAQVATYVTNVIKAANASGAAMNAMLKAQMLATALDVYFSDSALGGNKIGAPGAIGGVAIDLTKINKPIGSSTFENVSAAFGGATSLTVSQMLAYAAGQSNAGGSSWYGQVKSTQELAKDAFDAVNNQVAFAP